MLRNSTTGYGWLARLFHWLSFILLILLTLKGLSFEEMAKGPEKLAQIGNHKSVGTIFLLIVILRLFWRSVNPRPLPLGNDRRMMRLSALISGALYALMLIQPVSGILMSQAKGFPVSPFNAFTLPTMVAESEALASIFSQIHQLGWILIAALVVVHILGALKQHFIARNDTLRRIILQR